MEPNPRDSGRHPGRVLITHGRSLQALVVARSLGSRGVEVIAGDDTSWIAAGFSKFVSETFTYPTWEEGREAFLESIRETVEAHRPDDDRPYVLMPISRHTRLLASARDTLGDIRVAAPRIDDIHRVHPKDRLVETARELGLPIPPTILPSDSDELRAALPGIDFPVIMKIPDGSGGVGLEKVERREDLLPAYERLVERFRLGPRRRALIQGLVGDDDICVTALFENGRMRAQMVYRNVEHFPEVGGFGVLRETVEAPEAVAITERMFGEIGWHGIVEVDFRCNRDGSDPRLIEVNPRFWGGLFQSVESGIDYPWMLYRLTVDGHVEPAPSPKIGTRTRVPVLTLLAELSDLAFDDDAYERLRHGWRTGESSIRSGNWLRGLREIVAGVADAVDRATRLDRLRAQFERIQHTRTEIFSTDDPWASLGILYVLGSLIRHGRLPDEFSRHERNMLEDPYHDQEADPTSS